MLSYAIVIGGVRSHETDLASLKDVTAQANTRTAGLRSDGAFANMNDQRARSVRAVAATRVDYERLTRQLARILPAGVWVGHLDVAPAPPEQEVVDAGVATTAVFFFSSRRRHTRCSRDWSSDVCSSDLGERALQGVGGTRNCDWWFTDAAVLLDTAGRYTTQESDREADAAAWLGFLDLLKRSRPRQPLNGVIVTLSVADLVHWTDTEIARYAAHVRERVAELYQRLGVRLPLYVLVTKTDLLAGFMEFFANLDANGRAQVWGTTFESCEVVADPARRFDEEFTRLERRLYGLLPERLQEERDLQRRAAIYRFPQQFRGTGALIAAFLEGAFGKGWRGEAPLLRGVYFASGTQEGSPIDRVLGTLARSFNLERKVQPPNVGSGKSYFLRRLLHDVIFGEAGLAGADPAEERTHRRVRVA